MLELRRFDSSNWYYTITRCIIMRISIPVQTLINKDQYSWHLSITGINSHRRPAKEAQQLYLETQQSQEKRQQQIIQQKQDRSLFDIDRERRPNKKKRRQIHRFKETRNE